MKKTNLLFNFFAIIVLAITITACNNGNNGDNGDYDKDIGGGILDYDENAEELLLDETFVMNKGNSVLTIITKADGTFTAKEKSSSNELIKDFQGNYLRKNDLLRITDTKESQFFRVKDDNSLEPYTLNLETTAIGYGYLKVNKSKEKVMIQQTKNKEWFQIGIPYSKDFTDGCAYVYGSFNAWFEVAIGENLYGKDDNFVGYVSWLKAPYVCNLDSKHSFVLIKGAWNKDDTGEITKIVIGPKCDEGYNPNYVDVSKYKSTIPEDATVIFDALTTDLDKNFTHPQWGYITEKAFDSTKGLVLRFKFEADAYYSEAKFSFKSPINLENKTLYMVIKGKSNLDPSDNTDVKVTVCSGDGGSDTYKFIPGNNDEYVEYSATNEEFWTGYQKNTAADFSKIDSIVFNMAMAEYDFKIAAIYYK